MNNNLLHSNQHFVAVRQRSTFVNKLLEKLPISSTLTSMVVTVPRKDQYHARTKIGRMRSERIGKINNEQPLVFSRTFFDSTETVKVVQSLV